MSAEQKLPPTITAAELSELGITAATESAAERAVESVGARLGRARQAAGMTGAELGAAIGGLSKDQVSKIESGRRRLDIGELALAAEALGVSVDSLLGRPERAKLAMAARLVPGGDIHATRRRARQLLEVDDLLTQVTGMPVAKPSAAGVRALTRLRQLAAVTPRSKPRAREQGRQAALIVREELGLGSAPLGDVAGLMEQHFGVDVALAPLGTDADGLCVHSGDSALVLASSDFPDGHQRFTLGHELAHHLLGDPREIIDESERQMFDETPQEWRANAFAGHLLMPADGLREVISWLGDAPGAVTPRTVVALMERFGVSLAALIYQLNQVDLMSYEDGQRLKSQYSVARLVATHSDVAPTGAATIASRTRRAPERLSRHALIAARARRLGLSVVAAVLDRPDDEELWRIVMGSDDVAGAQSPPTPAPEAERVSDRVLL